MSLFGWLTKPALMVTFLDRIIMLGELTVVLVLGFFIYVLGATYQNRKNNRRR